MSVIAKQADDKTPLNPMSRTGIDSMELPSFRYLLGAERKTLRNILIQSPYALGDCVCAEPTIRYALKAFKDCSVSLITPFPELFYHLPLKEIMNPNVQKPDWDKYYVLKCYYAGDELQSEFVQNFNMAIGDYIATCVFKGQIPVADRNVRLEPNVSNMPQIEIAPNEVIIHAGRHWASKTFPKKWWDAIIYGLLAKGAKPVLIGANLEEGKRGFVEVDATNCTDYRDKLHILQTVSLLQRASVVLTNDSAPLHIAASGNAHIGFLSTVRHADFITHWRPDEMGKNQWGYKMHDFALGTMWQNGDVSPLKNGSKYDVIDQKTLISWLPEPSEVVDWAVQKLNLSKH